MPYRTGQNLSFYGGFSNLYFSLLFLNLFGINLSFLDRVCFKLTTKNTFKKVVRELVPLSKKNTNFTPDTMRDPSGVSCDIT